ncbi:Rab1 protein [Entamoeba marina]
MDEDYVFKIIVIGDSYVGKTCLLSRYYDQTFHDFNAGSISVDTRIKTIKIGRSLIKLIIWDTCGQEGFSSITKQFYRDADGAIIVYDVTSRESFMHVDQWLATVKAECNGSSCVLVGNKCDKIHEREIKTEDAITFSKTRGIYFLETSAKENYQVNDVFTQIAQIIKKVKPKIEKSNDDQRIKPEQIVVNNYHCC